MNSYFFDYVSGFLPEENILRNEPMALHTTFRIGGPAQAYLKVQTTQQLTKLFSYFKKADIPYVVIGNGSNLLVSDEGYKGVVVQIDAEMSKIEVHGEVVHAEAGASLANVAKAAYHAGLTGLEFAAGIPGTVGGAMVMNAGAYGSDMSNVVTDVHVMDTDGSVLRLDKEDMRFGYRSSVIKHRPFTAIDVSFQLTKGEPSAIQEKMQELMLRRKEKQPLEYPSAGSTFKRPEGHFAGQLIMESGLSGYKIGGAQVSEKHNGFIINTGDATAKDVMQLIRYVQQEVEIKKGVILEPEVVFLGEF